MSDQVTIAIIGGVTTAVVSTVGAVFAFLTAKALRETTHNSRKALEAAEQTQKNTNGLTQQLLERTASASHAQGRLEAQEEMVGKDR